MRAILSVRRFEHYRIGSPILLVIMLVILCTSPVGAAQALREQPIFSIPVGDDPSQISSEACTDCDEGACEAGIATVSEGGDIYFYDPPNNNIKVIAADGVRVMPGPSDIGTLSRLVVDMATGSGSVVLLADRLQLIDRFHLYLWTPQAATWQKIAFLSEPKLGMARIEAAGPRDVMAANTARLYRTSDGTICFYNRPSDMSYPVLSSDGPLPPSQQQALAFSGMKDLDGRSASEDPRDYTSPLRGLVLGHDTSGRVYTKAGQGFDTVLRVYENGAVIAEGIRPHRTNHKRMGGRGELLVVPGGGFYEFQPLKDRLVISRWSP